MNASNEGYFSGAGGLELYFQSWLPERAPRGVLAIVHGHGEHCGRYANVIDTLVPHGYAVYGFDLRGHGRSPGRRGHILAWSEYREDVRAFLARIHAGHPGTPLFLWGYSLGALIALEYALRLPETLDGVIVMGAPLEPVGVAKPHLVLLAKALSRIAPGYQINLGLNVAAVTRDPQVVQAGVSDPLMHPWASVRWGTECLHAVEWVKAHPADLRLPVLFLHGEADPYNRADGVRAYFEQVGCPDKEIKVYPDALHELHNDLGREQVIADMENWMDRHLALKA